VRNAAAQTDRTDMTLIRTSNSEAESARPCDANVAKAIVMAEIARIVEEGHAVITLLASGTLELRFTTGEVFHLGEEMITRFV
jgi:hypothetical protein